VRCLKVDTRLPNIVFNDRAQDRGLVRHADERLACKILQTDRLARRETMATILWLSALRRDGFAMSGWAFLKIGLVVTPPALLAALGAALLSQR
jgi:hypothetical protein